MDFRNRNITPANTMLEALKQMDSLDKKLLIVVEGVKFIGLISAGDIQRAIIQNTSLETPIKKHTPFKYSGLQPPIIPLKA
jgi:hypothetical protein